VPPAPKRKPADEPVAAQEAVAALPAPQEKPAKPKAPKPAQRQELARQEPTPPQAKGPWRPMGLAPADKPVPSQVPTARPSGAAYSSSVWSALARHKPRAGQRGTTTVVFAIGANGALRGLKVGRSSGNARIDQLALATVRSAAPFPPPPSGSASYTIRIDFH
jgi:protein TonB